MAKSKKTAKRNGAPESVIELRAFSENLKEVTIPAAVSDRFSPQVAKVCNRLNAIAKNMAKAIELDDTKVEREAKKKERVAARIVKLTKQLETGTAKLKELQKKK